MNPVRATGTFLTTIVQQTANLVQAAAFQFGGFARETIRTVSLASVNLAHLLWLIDRKFFELAVEGYGQNAAVYACLRLLSTSVPEPPLCSYYRVLNDPGEAAGVEVDEDGNASPGRQSNVSIGGKGDMLAWDHPLCQLIRNPNPLMTEYEMFEIGTLQLGICGRALFWKERNNANQPMNIWPLRPDRVGPIYGGPEDNGPLIGWSYLVPGTMKYVPLAREDVILINFADPAGESGGMVEGLGPLQVLFKEVSADNSATQFVGDLISNYAAPGVVIQTTTPIPSREKALEIKQNFMVDYGGRKRGEPGVLDNGATIHDIGFSLSELEFPALRSIAESRIAAAFGVPAVLAGLNVGLETAGGGVGSGMTDQLRQAFTQTTLANYWRRFSIAFTNQLAVDFGPNLMCDFDLSEVQALSSQDKDERDSALKAWAEQLITMDEARSVLGWAKHPTKGNMFISGIAPGTGAGVWVDANGVQVGVPPVPGQLPAPANGNGRVPASTAQAAVNGAQQPVGAAAPGNQATTTAAAAAPAQRADLSDTESHLTPDEETAAANALLEGGLTEIFDDIEAIDKLLKDRQGEGNG